MNCHNHRENPAIAIATCRVCSVGLCDSCGIPVEKGFVCSDACRSRSEAINKMLDSQEASFRGHFNWFFMPALLVVIGVLLVGERALFGTPVNTVKVIMGIVLLVVGFAYVFYVIYIKRNFRP
ncbi:MAG: hypothetical protein FWH15_05510 [Betaproteobacteria bacterium]|nr:hypothetical protein [Betaproteobacteria bacterium]